MMTEIGIVTRIAWYFALPYHTVCESNCHNADDSRM